MSSSKDPASISAISPLTSANYCLWADDMKSWLQLNALLHLVSGQEKKPAAKPEIYLFFILFYFILELSLLSTNYSYGTWKYIQVLILLVYSSLHEDLLEVDNGW